MIDSFAEVACDRMTRTARLGAQAVRRGGAGPVIHFPAIGTHWPLIRIE